MIMNHSEVDLTQLITLFDQALLSQDPRVRQCLNNLLLITSLAQSQDNETRAPGPYSQLMARVNKLQATVDNLQSIHHTIHNQEYRRLVDNIVAKHTRPNETPNN
jgi:phosphohistidine phosphatase SixA